MYTNVKFADAYYRLSIEEAAKSESGSITNQKNIVRKYCKDNNIVIVKEFVDACHEEKIGAGLYFSIHASVLYRLRYAS